MKKMVMATLFFVLFAPIASFAIMDAGNKFCPVSGDKISGKHFVEYEGKKYSLCCPMCSGKFKRNPAKYLAKMKIQEANPNAVVHKDHKHMNM